MLRLLKQSTAATLLLGPFIDDTDGKTAETALTLSQADVLLWKQGGTTLAQKNESTSCTHRSHGLYTCPVDTTDTNTLGILTVSVQESGALPVRQDYAVVPANIFDSLVSGSDLVDVSVTQWNGTAVATPDTAGYVKATLKSGTGTGEVSLTSGIASVNASQIAGNTTAATNLSGAARGIVLGTVSTAGFSPTTTEFESGDVTEATADHYNGRLVLFYSGALAGQQTLIQDYALSSGRGHFTVVAMTEAPGNGDAFTIV
jgi:hypothetical protein